MSAGLRIVVSAGHSEGHAFPAIALAGALHARGHDVMLEQSERWRDVAESLGLRFSPAREHTGFAAPDAERGGLSLAAAAGSLAETLRDFGADVVVSDVVAPAPPLAAELNGIGVATLIPVVYPPQAPQLPRYRIGLVAPRTPLGAGLWRLTGPPLRALDPESRWLRRVPPLLDLARAELGLAPLVGAGDRITTYGPISEGLALVATLPQLEYPRRWPPHVHLTGPMPFELDYPDVELPDNGRPLVLVAASTGQDSRLDLVRGAVTALEREPVDVVATINRPGEAWPWPVPENGTVVDWISYSQVMPRASLVITSGGHGTVVRALCEGTPVLVCPGGGDMAENGARATWAGAGLMLPRRLLGVATLRLAARRMLSDESFAARAREIAAWSRRNDGAAIGAALVERYALR